MQTIALWVLYDHALWLSILLGAKEMIGNRGLLG